MICLSYPSSSELTQSHVKPMLASGVQHLPLDTSTWAQTALLVSRVGNAFSTLVFWLVPKVGRCVKNLTTRTAPVKERRPIKATACINTQFHRHDGPGSSNTLDWIMKVQCEANIDLWRPTQESMKWIWFRKNPRMILKTFKPQTVPSIDMCIACIYVYTYIW